MEQSQGRGEDQIPYPDATAARDPYREWIWDAEAGDHWMYIVDSAYEYPVKTWYSTFAQTQLHQQPVSEVPQSPNSSHNVSSTGVRHLPQNMCNDEVHPSYLVRNRRFFEQGRMFAILAHEPEEFSTNLDSDTETAVDEFGILVYYRTFRLVVVQTGTRLCYACPVTSYWGQGTNRAGVTPSSHAVVHTVDTEPVYLEGEEDNIDKEAIAIEPSDGTIRLHPASRIDFGVRYPVSHNWRVKDLGKVCEEDQPNFIYYAVESFEPNA